MITEAELLKDKRIDFYNSDEKEKMYNAEIKKLKKVYNVQDLVEPQKTVVIELIEHLAFDIVEIKNKQAVLRVNGSVSKYNNGGGQSGIRENPNLTACLKIKKDYRETLIRLNEIINIENNTNDDEELLKFINAKD